MTSHLPAMRDTGTCCSTSCSRGCVEALQQASSEHLAHNQPRSRTTTSRLCAVLMLQWTLLLSSSHQVTCGKVLVIPLPSAESHTFVMVKIAQELADRGNDVLMVVPTSDMDTLAKVDVSAFNVTTYAAAFSKQEVKEMVRDTRAAVGNNFLGSLESFLAYLDALMSYCELFLEDEAAGAAMRAFNADVLVGDVAYACALGQSELLRRGEGGVGPDGRRRPERVPRVMVSALPMLDPLVPGRMESVPNNLAYVPQMGTTFSNRMSFWQRLANLAFYYGSLAGEQLRALPLYQRLCGKYGVDCLSTPVAHGSTMFLYNMDWAMEWPRPLPPNVQLVGALLPTPAQPLSPAFQALLEGVGPEGAVYVSMGTLCNFGASEFAAIAAALSDLSHRVIWKLAPGDLPGNASIASLGLAPNVKVVDWTPQNDLLGDPRVRAFVTHGGLNSIYEAAFHGVPIVGIPVFGDQPDNVMKSVNRGLGVTIQPGKITREGLRAAVEQVISADSYAQAAARISVRMRAHRVSPVEKAADWIQHVLTTEGEQYLKTPEHLLPWHVRHMLDVWTCVLAVVAGICWLCYGGACTLAGHMKSSRWQKGGKWACEEPASVGKLAEPGIAAVAAAVAAAVVLVLANEQ